MSRLNDELALLRKKFSDLDFIEEGLWVRLPTYEVPSPLWRPTTIHVAFQIPPQMAAAPYAFHVRPLDDDPITQIELVEKGAINNYSHPATTPWGQDWGTFSWAPEAETWLAAEPLRSGSTMLQFALSFADRFKEGP